MKYYSELAKPNKEVLEIIKDLHTKYKVFLFSNTTEMSNNHNSKTGLYDYFDDLFLSYRLGMKKPDQQIYRKTISLIGCKAEECVFIDDEIKNLEPAEKMGMKTILFNVLIDLPSELKVKLRKLGCL